MLVTGGCGFIASNFIRFILHEYPQTRIINLDKLTYCGNLNNLKDIEQNHRYTFIKGDICDLKLVNDLVSKSDVVVNFAAESYVDKSFHEPMEFTLNNVLGAHTMAEAVKRNKNVRKFLHIGTDEVYGSLKSTDPSCTESTSLMPRNPYSASKAGADMMMMAYYTAYRIPLLVTRSSNNFGPYQYPEKFVPLCITNALQEQSIPVHGTGAYYRDWMYVLDNCSAIDSILQGGSFGEFYNIGAGNDRQNIEVAKEILAYLGKSEDLLVHVLNRVAQDARYSLDTSKIKKLGWKPKYNFKDALSLTIDWYKANKPWWQGLANKYNLMHINP